MKACDSGDGCFLVQTTSNHLSDKVTENQYVCVCFCVTFWQQDKSTIILILNGDLLKLHL